MLTPIKYDDHTYTSYIHTYATFASIATGPPTLLYTANISTPQSNPGHINCRYFVYLISINDINTEISSFTMKAVLII